MTGSTSGIGLACARAFASAGANIVLNGIGVPAEVEKDDRNDFEVKSVNAPRGDQCGGLAAKTNLRASATGEDREIRIRVHVGHGS
jgi:NAD(P)-dependent dehydrogenase (short-subunit alcohol dehydrogenase family)